MPAIINVVFDYLNTLLTLAAAVDPVGMLYAMLAATYGKAAHAASTDDHRTLAHCYVISAVLHGLIGTAHQFGW
jgi:hypothetical protein